MISLNSINLVSGGLAALVVIVLVGFALNKRIVNQAYFDKRWQKVQKNCSTPKNWTIAIVDADNLLGEALKKLHFKGKTTADRLVSAQRQLSSNHSVWFSHKLRNRIDEENLTKVSKTDTKRALAGFYKALKDIGALTTELKPERKSHGK